MAFMAAALLSLTADGKKQQQDSSVVYVARYSYDDMGNMVLRRWVPNYASLRRDVELGEKGDGADFGGRWSRL